MGISRDFNPSITHPQYLTRKPLLRAIRRFAAECRGNLLDFGCGSKPYRDLFTVDKYVGVDFEGEGHSHQDEQIDFFYDGKTLPFAYETFDSIFSSEVFEHVFNLPEILSELSRVLKPGGSILVTCPFAICEHEVPNDFARYTSYALRHMFEEKGFEVLALEKTGNQVTTIHQLWIMYIHQHITPYFRKIPVIRSAFRLLTYTGLNLLALFWSKVLPDRKDLYLNTVILCRKTSHN